MGARLIHPGSDEGSYSVSIILVKKRRRRSTSEADFRAHFQLVSSRILSCDLRFVGQLTRNGNLDNIEKSFIAVLA